MSTQAIEKHLESVEVYYGEVCKQKTLELLEELDLPNGLLPLEDIEEVGRNKETGFVWLKQKKAVTHFWRKIGRHVIYDKEITAVVEKHKMKKVTGVKSKELLIWVAIGEIYIVEKDPQKIEFKNPTVGIARSFPVSVFIVDEKKMAGGSQD